MKELAKSLVETLNHYHRRERPATSDEKEVWELLQKLEEEKGLITTRASRSQGTYVLLDSVHHGPVMLGTHSEIFFRSLEFARLCRDAYKALPFSSAPSILQVVELGGR